MASRGFVAAMAVVAISLIAVAPIVGASSDADEAARTQTLLSWVQGHGVDTSKITIRHKEGHGRWVEAGTEIKEGDTFMMVPNELMMHGNSAKDPKHEPVASLVANNPTADDYTNIVLLLMHEKFYRAKNGGKSFWEPYLDLLPSYYATPHYYSKEESELLSLVSDDAKAKFEGVNEDLVAMYEYIKESYLVPNPQIFGPDQEDDQDRWFDEVRWTVATIQTRSYGPEDALPAWPRMIPFSDLNNNAKDHEQQNVEYASKPASGEWPARVEWYALRPLKPGDEIFARYDESEYICNFDLLLRYGYTSQDSCERDCAVVSTNVGWENLNATLRCSDDESPPQLKTILRAKALETELGADSETALRGGYTDPDHQISCEAVIAELNKVGDRWTEISKKAGVKTALEDPIENEELRWALHHAHIILLGQERAWNNALHLLKCPQVDELTHHAEL